MMYITKIGVSGKVPAPAPLDRVLEIIAGVDSEPKYYPGLNFVRNINRTGNVIGREVIERKVTVGFRDLRGRQIVMLNPMRSVEIVMKGGVMTGTRTVILTTIVSGIMVDIAWDIEVSCVPMLFRGNVKNRIAKGTEEAPDRIARAAQ